MYNTKKKKTIQLSGILLKSFEYFEILNEMKTINITKSFYSIGIGFKLFKYGGK